MNKVKRNREQQRDAQPNRLQVAPELKQGVWLRWTTRFGWLIPLLLALLVNANVLLNDFAWDDVAFIESPTSTSTIEPAFLISKAYYRPFIGWSYEFDRWIWGLTPFGFHLSVYLAHALTTLLVYVCVVSLLGLYKKERGIALITASLFAIHPIHTEAVAWIAGRNDVYMALFVLIALYAYLRYRQKPSWATLLIFTLGSVLGLLSKETAIPFLLMVPVLDFLFHHSGVIRWRGMKEPLIGLWTAMLGAFILYRFSRVGLPPAQTGAADSSYNSLLNPFITLGYYLKLLVIPHPLNLFVGELPAENAQGLLYLLIGASGLMLLLWVIFRWNRTLFAVGIVWFVLGITAPLAVQLLKVSATLVAERYTYLASGGFLLVMSMWGYEGFRRVQIRFPGTMGSQWGMACLALIIVLFSSLTMERNAIWRMRSLYGRTQPGSRLKRPSPITIWAPPINVRGVGKKPSRPTGRH